MTLEQKKTETPDIYTIFTYRYLFDTKNDIVDLRADVYDLQHFPERLLSSYQAEWTKYNKKAAAKRGIDLNKREVSTLIENLSPEQQQELREFLNMIESAVAINESKNIKVIKTGLKAYIESLIKL